VGIYFHNPILIRNQRKAPKIRNLLCTPWSLG